MLPPGLQPLPSILGCAEALALTSVPSAWPEALQEAWRHGCPLAGVSGQTLGVPTGPVHQASRLHLPAPVAGPAHPEELPGLVMCLHPLSPGQSGSPPGTCTPLAAAVCLPSPRTHFGKDVHQSLGDRVAHSTAPQRETCCVPRGGRTRSPQIQPFSCLLPRPGLLH